MAQGYHWLPVGKHSKTSEDDTSKAEGIALVDHQYDEPTQLYV